MPERFEGKVAIVTGGANGIGAAVCRRLSSEGARVVVADLDKAAAERTVEGLKHGLAVQTDVSDEAQVQALVAAAVKWGGSIDLYVNNAAKFAFGTVNTVSNTDWDSALSINLKGYAFGMKHASQAMIDQAKQAADKEATNNSSEDTRSQYAIVNLSSTAGVIAQPDMVPYCTTKAGILGMTRSCALDLGKHNISYKENQKTLLRLGYGRGMPAKFGLNSIDGDKQRQQVAKVNAVVPGGTETQSLIQWAADAGMTPAGVVEFQANHIVLQRLGKPEEVAAAVAFLLSSDASFITGTSLNVDGGYLIR